MEVVARLNNLRMAPRKVRLVANLISGKPADVAVAELRYATKACAAPLTKLIRAAMADAEHNYKLAKETLVIRSMIVESAPTFKRFQPKAFGRAGSIRKRGSNVIVTLVSSAPTPTTTEKTAAKKTTKKVSKPKSSLAFEKKD